MRGGEAMRTIARRVSRLEERFAPRIDEQGRSPAEVIRERWRRRLAAEGRKPDEDPLPEDSVDPGYWPRTLAEILRGRFRGRDQLIGNLTCLTIAEVSSTRARQGTREGQG